MTQDHDTDITTDDSDDTETEQAITASCGWYSQKGTP